MGLSRINCLISVYSRYRPDLVNLDDIENSSVEECNALAFKIFEQEMGIKPVMSAKDSVTLDNVDIKVWLHYLEQICEVFRGEIPHVKHPKLDYAEYKQKNKPNTMADFSRLHRLATSKHAEDLLTRNNRKPLEEGATSHVIGRVKKLGVENYPSEYNFDGLYLQFLINYLSQLTFRVPVSTKPSGRCSQACQKT